MPAESQETPHLSLVTGTSLASRPMASRHPGAPALPDGNGSGSGNELGNEHVTPLRPPPPAAPGSCRAPGSRALRSRLFLVDLVAAAVGWIAVGAGGLHAPSATARLVPGVAAAAASLVAMRATGLYRSRLCVRRSDELGRVLFAGLWGTAAFLVVQNPSLARAPAALAGGTCFVAMAAVLRWIFGRWLRAQRARGRFLRRVVLVGANDDAAALRTMLRSEPELGYAVSAVVGEAAGDPGWGDLPASTSVADIPALAAATRASGILVVPSGASGATTQRAIAVARGEDLHVQLWPGLRGIGSRHLRTVPVSGEAFFYVEPRVPARWKTAAKRAIDVVGAVVGLVAGAPFIAAAAVLIKLEDRGPVFHAGERVGRYGRPIRVHKLRSMVPGADSFPADVAGLNERTDGPLFKASRDPRITAVGRFIRATSIDELPQLWDVLRGTMSLVGPRPALPSEVAKFDAELQRRHSVRPGLTGLWQVEARDNPSFNAYRRLDLRYVDDWSLSMDLSIMLATVPSLVGQALHAFSRSRRA